MSRGKPITPESAQKYLESKFGDAPPEAMKAMTQLANSMTSKELALRAIELYGKFRPAGAEGRPDGE